MIMILLPLIILGSMGAILIFVGSVVGTSSRKKRAACTARTIGKVIKYVYPGNQSVAPLAEYIVDGKKYKESLKYRYVVHAGRKQASLSNIVIKNYKKFASERWPIGSDIDVFYDPEKPSRSYVDYVPEKGPVVTPVFIGVGAFFLVLGILLTVLMGLSS